MPINWRDLTATPAPRDRPVGLLSMQMQENGGFIATFDICCWNADGGCFTLGVGFESGVGHGCATHWCEVEELDLPPIPMFKETGYPDADPA